MAQAAGGGWRIVDQIDVAGTDAPFAADGAPPTRLEKAAARATADASLVPILLSMRDGAWAFGGDGSAGFVPPLAPMPKDEDPPVKWSVGDAIEIGPTDDGYLGSWYEGEVVATSGGPDPASVQVRYAKLEDDDGAPLTEWQPKACLRPRPPPVIPEASASGFAVGDPLQMWYNDGWWECVVVPTARRQGGGRRRRRRRRRRPAVGCRPRRRRRRSASTSSITTRSTAA